MLIQAYYKNMNSLALKMLVISLACFAELMLQDRYRRAVVVADNSVLYIGFLSAHQMLFLQYC